MRRTVKVPYAHLRREKNDKVVTSECDQLQETQLLIGEGVICLKDEGQWSFVEAPEQPVYDGSWSGYRGWVRSQDLLPVDYSSNLTLLSPLTSVCLEDGSFEQLTLGTRLMGERAADKWLLILPDGRRGRCSLADAAQNVECDIDAMLTRARGCLGWPYFWGGRSGYVSGQATSVDCSAYIQLLYQTMGITLPRNSRDQFRVAKGVDELQKGDVVFLAKSDDPETIYHIMLYAGGEELLEAAESSRSVRSISSSDRLGCLACKIQTGKKMKDFTLFCGSFLR